MELQTPCTGAFTVAAWLPSTVVCQQAPGVYTVDRLGVFFWETHAEPRKCGGS